MSENNHRAMSDIRDADIRAAVERRRADDVKIMQKVNAANREAFTQRFPGQIEHNMRLISERLSNILFKDPDTILTKPDTWPAGCDEIAALAQALWNLEQVRQNWPAEQE